MNIVSQFIQSSRGSKINVTLLFFYFVWMAALISRSISGLDDFDVFFHAGKRILLKDDIYVQSYYNHLKFYYSPLFALLLSPFTGLPVTYVKIIWFLVNYILLIRCVFIIRQYTVWNFKGSTFVLLFLCICSGKVIMHNFLANQMSILILWTMLESFRMYTARNTVMAILLFCVGLNFKILSIMVLPFYFIVNHIRFKMLFPAFTIMLLIVPAISISWHYNIFLLQQWWAGINPADQFHVIQTSEQGFVDLGSLVTRYLTSGRIVNEPLVNVINLGYGPIFLITNFIRLSLVLLTIAVVRNLKHHVYGVHRDLARIVPFIAMVPMVLPHQRDYSFLLVMPMLIVLVLFLCRLQKKGLYLLFCLSVIVSGLLAWSTILGSSVVEFFYSYRLITIGMLSLFILYLYVVNTVAQRNFLISSQDVQK